VHVVDMEGRPLTIDVLRRYLINILNTFGSPSVGITSPEVRADLESNLDGAGRLAYPISGQQFKIGQFVGGIRTNDMDISLVTDLQLGPLHGRGKYKATAQRGAPNAPTGTAVAGAVGGGRTTKWVGADAGAYFYMVTEVKDDSEGLGVRIPSTGTVTVAAGDEVTLTLTPADPTSNSFRVYRGVSGDANTEAYFAFEVACSSSGAAVTAYDQNKYRPNTHYAFFLDIRSLAQKYIAQSQSGTLPQSGVMSPTDMVAEFGTQPDTYQNTVTRARLGPEYGQMELAALTMTRARPVIFSAQALQLRAPARNIVFRNIGPRIVSAT
jgi:hypothetical protein